MPVRFVFSDLRELFGKANEEKSGDQLAGLAARSNRERVAAKQRLADLPYKRLPAPGRIARTERNKEFRELMSV